MTACSRFKSALLAALIAAIILPAQLHAENYKLLKTRDSIRGWTCKTAWNIIEPWIISNLKTLA